MSSHDPYRGQYPPPRPLQGNESQVSLTQQPAANAPQTHILTEIAQTTHTQPTAEPPTNPTVEDPSTVESYHDPHAISYEEYLRRLNHNQAIDRRIQEREAQASASTLQHYPSSDVLTHENVMADAQRPVSHQPVPQYQQAPMFASAQNLHNNQYPARHSFSGQLPAQVQAPMQAQALASQPPVQSPPQFHPHPPPSMKPQPAILPQSMMHPHPHPHPHSHPPPPPPPPPQPMYYPRQRPYDSGCSCASISCCWCICTIIALALLVAGIFMIATASTFSNGSCPNMCPDISNNIADQCVSDCQRIMFDALRYGGIGVTALAGLCTLWQVLSCLTGGRRRC